jgi:hypothetical protein
VSVPFEHLRAEPEEGRIREAIILKDYSLLLVLEEPVQRGRDGPPTAEVPVPVESPNVTRPIDFSLDCGAGLSATSRVRHVAITRTIGGDVKAFRTQFAEDLEYLARSLGTVEHAEEHGELAHARSSRKGPSHSLGGSVPDVGRPL